MTTKIFYGFLLLLLCVGTVKAQEHRSKEERIKAVKVAFITEELELTPEQSQGFWPLYNEMQEKLYALKRQHKKKVELDKMSDAEIEAFLEEHLRLSEEKIELHRAYIQKFKAVITLQQIAKLTRSEHRFRRELLKRSKERREGRRGEYHKH
ncbi:Spy/CpxP family protein refolding chaperone [Aureispira anguillae]|uniref:Spy/CpxP family protein refolding chaperone n=1 Tax=Aureispira anguillae TaxID=2864201 RepID=A0A916DW95_9BACT|nr:Spy/CpxP family protein refolding chaperone [Aureispira anguillae]BDS14425.1 Spy/CpxP family protein refolding chaperone [Aureispira anguillae]